MGVTSQLALSPLWHQFLLSQPSQEVTGLDPVLSTRLEWLSGSVVWLHGTSSAARRRGAPRAVAEMVWAGEVAGDVLQVRGDVAD